MQQIIRKAAQLSGGITALATGLKINRQAIYQWSRIPAERVIQIERLSGIPRGELRPDLFGTDASMQDQPASTSDIDVTVAGPPKSVDLLPEELPDRVLPADGVRAGNAASTAPACEPADSN